MKNIGITSSFTYFRDAELYDYKTRRSNTRTIEQSIILTHIHTHIQFMYIFVLVYTHTHIIIDPTVGKTIFEIHMSHARDSLQKLGSYSPTIFMRGGDRKLRRTPTTKSSASGLMFENSIRPIN